MSQDELARKMADAGLPFRLAGRLERGEQRMGSAHLQALTGALGLPERFFTAPVDEICPPEFEVEVLERYAELHRKLDIIIQRLAEL
jgi:transcriptional regulator with XRE-family HTH domain